MPRVNALSVMGIFFSFSIISQLIRKFKFGECIVIVEKEYKNISIISVEKRDIIMNSGTVICCNIISIHHRFYKS